MEKVDFELEETADYIDLSKLREVGQWRITTTWIKRWATIDMKGCMTHMIRNSRLSAIGV